MNAFFCDIGVVLSNKIKQPNNTNLKLSEKNLKTMPIEPTDCSEIYKVINELKN